MTVSVSAAASPAAPSSATAVVDATSSRAASAGLRPVTPDVREYAVRGVSRAGLATLAVKPDKFASLAALSASRPVSGFGVTGVTWTGQAPPGLELAIRTETGGAWSTWTFMVSDEDHAPDPESAEGRRAVPGTDPFVIGAVDDVQLKAISDTGRAPRGLTLAVIDPGTTTQRATSALDSTPTATEPAETLAAGKAPMPTIKSRADWGADESLRDCCVEYGTVQAGFVHHTVNANGYSRAEVPAIIRGIYAYHTQSRGWRDIGYNFLIDRFGGIWEGRYGGITKAVVGAHTLNYNQYAFAASAIGNYDVTAPSTAMVDSFARLFAWKLGLYGIKPASRPTVGGTTFDAISGHRDAAQTACPGKYLYAKIATIISKATSYQNQSAAPRGQKFNHSLVGSGRADILLAKKSSGRISIARGTGPPGFGRATTAVSDFAGHNEVAGVGDVTGDKVNDMMARDHKTLTTTLYRGRGKGTFVKTSVTTNRFSGTDLFAGAGDLDEDGQPDVVARDKATGRLLFYHARGSGEFAKARVAKSAFSGADRLTSAGDFDGDGHRDIVARGASGELSVYYGDGTGTFSGRAVLAANWSDKGLISGGADLTGDGRPDLVARDSTTKVLNIFANVGGTRLSPPVASLRAPMASLNLTSDLTGDHRPDLLTMTPGGSLDVIRGHRQNWTTRPLPRSARWPGMNRVRVVGDWNRDGTVDAMATSGSTGRLYLYPSRKKGGFGDRVGGWRGWDNKTMLTAVGDLDVDGRPDLMARSPGGQTYLYPGRGEAGFGRRIEMTQRVPSGATGIAVGRWDDDRSPDVLVGLRDGKMMLFHGNGAGALRRPALIGTGFDRYQSLLGIGDATRDRQPDVLARTAHGDVYLIPGRQPTGKHPNGGLAKPRYVGSGWSHYLMG